MHLGSRRRDRGAPERAGLLGLLAAACVLAAGQAWGQAQYCVAPVNPACLSLRSTFERPVSIDRCRQDLDDFLAEIRSYEACLSELIATTERRAEEVARAFACRAEGRKDCDGDRSQP